MRSVAIVLPLVMLSACGSCVGDDETKSTQQSSTTATEDGGRGGSRFAKPFVPGQATALPERRDE